MEDEEKMNEEATEEATEEVAEDIAEEVEDAEEQEAPEEPQPDFAGMIKALDAKLALAERKINDLAAMFVEGGGVVSEGEDFEEEEEAAIDEILTPLEDLDFTV